MGKVLSIAGTPDYTLTQQKTILDERLSLEADYQVALSRLVWFLKQPRETHDKPFYDERNGLIKEVQDKARPLLCIYEKLSPNPSKVRNIQGTLTVCQTLLRGKKTFSETEEAALCKSETPGITTRIRDTTGDLNWYRLFLLRSKRFFDALAPVVKSINGAPWLEDFVNGIDQANPVLNYIAWAYYVPRILTNAILLLKHTLPGVWMGDEEKKLGWKTRLNAEWSKRWFEILNDGVWCLVGLLNCFLLSSPHAMLLTVGLYLFDVGMAVVNAFIQLKKYNHLLSLVTRQIGTKEKAIKDAREQALSDKDIQPLAQQIQTLKGYQEGLFQWKGYEWQRLRQSICVTLGLTGGMIMGAIPTVAILAGATLSGPWGLVLPLLAAVIVLGVCVAQYISARRIAQEKPDTDIKDMGNLRAFIGVDLSFLEDNKQDSDTLPQSPSTSRNSFFGTRNSPLNPHQKPVEDPDKRGGSLAFRGRFSLVTDTSL